MNIYFCPTTKVWNLGDLTNLFWVLTTERLSNPMSFFRGGDEIKFSTSPSAMRNNKSLATNDTNFHKYWSRTSFVREHKRKFVPQFVKICAICGCIFKNYSTEGGVLNYYKTLFFDHCNRLHLAAALDLEPVSAKRKLIWQIDLIKTIVAIDGGRDAASQRV